MSQATANRVEDPTLSDLVHDARGGSQTAWNMLVDRYLPLVRMVARTHRLSDKDTEDVSQTVC